MKLKILGCSGGISGSRRTTAMLLDEDVLIDAGTGAADLSIEAMAKIDHIFVTHSHLDHICSIPLLVDTVGQVRGHPVTVHAIGPTLEALQAHIFNNVIWPDFSRLPRQDAPLMRYSEVEVGETVQLAGRKITVLPANHLVPAVGYCLNSGAGSLVFTGDTTINDPLWAVVNQLQNLRYLIIETAFCDRERRIAVASKHLCPSLLAEELAKLVLPAEVYITHLKPGEMELTMEEIRSTVRERQPRMLQTGQVFEF
ncbi:MAG: 3',5'-cyclic-nucleotide phosphodiesterase [Burkholderiales bacterium]|nr:3',5'-cyclic-nucleotide phosphodiesterase [Burkholderiales bacterium]